MVVRKKQKANSLYKLKLTTWLNRDNQVVPKVSQYLHEQNQHSSYGHTLKSRLM